MFVQTLELSDYRNFHRLQIQLHRHMNIFVGDNAQGKTNLMESVYLLATARSHRASRDGDLIRWGEKEAEVAAQVVTQAGTFHLRVKLFQDKRKRVWVGGEEIRRQADLLGYLNIVLFSPDDLQLVKGSPAQRRQFIDLALAQVSKVYRYEWMKYHKVLQQRNKLLKAIQERKGKAELLPLWDEQLIELGCRTMYRRAQAIARIAGYARESHKQITGGNEVLTVTYVPFYVDKHGFTAAGQLPESPEKMKQRFSAALETARREEVRRGTTLVGPQRDDILFQIDGKDARQFASQGQQRTVVLAAKLAQLEFMREEVGEYPALLLDDVMSELDQRRRSFFLETINTKVQTLLTTTSLKSFSRKISQQSRRFTIWNGQLTLKE